jgi:hypothetical protein
MPRRPAPWSVPLARLAVLAAAGHARAQSERGRGRIHGATHCAPSWGQLDTNAHRTEVVNVPGSSTRRPSCRRWRGACQASLSDVVGDGHQVSYRRRWPPRRSEGDARGGTSRSPRARPRGAPLGERGALVLAGAYCEAFQRDARRLSTHRIGATSGRSRRAAALARGATSSWAWPGLPPLRLQDRGFDFRRPRPRSISAGRARPPTAPPTGCDLSRQAARCGWPWSCGRRLPDEPDLPPTSGTELRLDHFMTGSLDVSLGASSSPPATRANLNLSTFGDTITRHFVTARFAVALPWTSGGAHRDPRRPLRRQRHRRHDRRPGNGPSLRQHRGREPQRRARRAVAQPGRPPALLRYVLRQRAGLRRRHYRQTACSPCPTLEK